MSNKNEVFEYLIDQLRQQVNNSQCEDLAQEVQSLKNQLRDASAQIKELHLALVKATVVEGEYKLARKGGYISGAQRYVVGEHGPEQSGCHKEDAQECEHDWRVVQYAAGVETDKCRLCGEEKEVRYGQSGCRKEDVQECYHNWRFVNGKAHAVCVNCGVTKPEECEHEWEYYYPNGRRCTKCGVINL